MLQTVHDGRIYTVKLYCDQNYPDKVSLFLELYGFWSHCKLYRQVCLVVLSRFLTQTGSVGTASQV